MFNTGSLKDQAAEFLRRLQFLRDFLLLLALLLPVVEIFTPQWAVDLLQVVGGFVEVDPRSLEPDRASRVARVGERVAEPAVLAEITDVDGALTNDVITHHVFIRNLVVDRGGRIRDLMVEFFVPDGPFSRLILDGGLVEMDAIDAEFAEGIHLSKKLGVASQIRIANFDVEKADHFVSILSGFLTDQKWKST